MFQRSTVKIILAALCALAAVSANASSWSLGSSALGDPGAPAAAASARYLASKGFISGSMSRPGRAVPWAPSVTETADKPTLPATATAQPSSNLQLLGSPLTADLNNLVDCFGASEGMYRMSLCRRGVALSADALKRMLGPNARLTASVAAPAVPLPAGLPLLLCGLALLALRARRHAHH